MKKQSKFQNTPEDLETILSGETKESLSIESYKWFDQIKKGINTSSEEKKEIQKGLWYKCNHCNYSSITEDFDSSWFVCPSCQQHLRIGSKEYYKYFFDNGDFEELFGNIVSKDYLNFTDLKPYKDRIKEIRKKTGLQDSMRVAVGKMRGVKLVIACMDFEFIGGSLGSVMGEKFWRACQYCIQHHLPYMVICKSGGARMMESAFSLMQLAKTSGALQLLSRKKLPYISYLTDPSFGGISASFGMLGDFNIAEPNALIGFAGPRVVKETIRKELPENFQKSELLLENGFLDFIVERKQAPEKISTLLKLLGF